MARLLIVEDEVHSARALETFFESLGHEVRTAATAGRALELLAELRPEVVLTDLLLAGEHDGIYLARHVADGDEGPPVLLMSGLPTEEIERRSEGARLFLTLPKPLRLSTVKEAVEAALAAED